MGKCSPPPWCNVKKQMQCWTISNHCDISPTFSTTNYKCISSHVYLLQYCMLHCVWVCIPHFSMNLIDQNWSLGSVQVSRDHSMGRPWIGLDGRQNTAKRNIKQLMYGTAVMTSSHPVWLWKYTWPIYLAETKLLTICTDGFLFICPTLWAYLGHVAEQQDKLDAHMATSSL
jgi:hypothetical protein